MASLPTKIAWRERERYIQFRNWCEYFLLLPLLLFFRLLVSPLLFGLWRQPGSDQPLTLCESNTGSVENDIGLAALLVHGWKVNLVAQNIDYRLVL